MANVEPQPVELTTPDIQESQPVEQTVGESEPQANVCYHYLLGLNNLLLYIYFCVKAEPMVNTDEVGTDLPFKNDPTKWSVPYLTYPNNFAYEVKKVYTYC